LAQGHSTLGLQAQLPLGRLLLAQCM